MVLHSGYEPKWKPSLCQALRAFEPIWPSMGHGPLPSRDLSSKKQSPTRDPKASKRSQRQPRARCVEIAAAALLAPRPARPSLCRLGVPQYRGHELIAPGRGIRGRSSEWAIFKADVLLPTPQEDPPSLSMQMHSRSHGSGSHRGFLSQSTTVGLKMYVPCCFCT